jgi:hypothetical protein
VVVGEDATVTVDDYGFLWIDLGTVHGAHKTVHGTRRKAQGKR